MVTAPKLPPLDPRFAPHAPKPPDAAIARAVQRRLRALLRTADLSIPTLLEIERTARLARDLLAITIDPRALEPVPACGVGYGSGLSTAVNIGPYAQSAPSETYGATVLREILAAAKEFRRDPSTELDALLRARDHARRRKGKKDRALAKRLDAKIAKLTADLADPAPAPKGLPIAAVSPAMISQAAGALAAPFLGGGLLPAASPIPPVTMPAAGVL